MIINISWLSKKSEPEKIGKQARGLYPSGRGHLTEKQDLS